MEDWLRNKQYHQLTEALLKETMNQTLYDTYVLPVEQHIHPLKLAVLAGRTAQVKQPQDALIFLQNLLAKFTPSDEDFKRWTCFKIQAFLYLKLLLVQYHQVLLQHDTAQLLLDQVKVAMERVLSFEPIVSAQYYRVVSDVYQTKGEYELYYEASFEYLKYAEHMTKEDKYHRSMHMAIAALLGNTYRFGELMGHPIFEHVDPWMRSVIVAAEGGQLVQLDQLKKDIMSHVVDVYVGRVETALGYLGSQVPDDGLALCAVPVQQQAGDLSADIAEGQNSQSGDPDHSLDGTRPAQGENRPGGRGALH